MSKRARGQATVELALGSLIFVSLFLIAAFLIEVQSLGLKLHEASSYAAYDAMSERSQRTRAVSLSEMGRVSGSTVGSPGGDATDRYRDFDGVNTGGSSTITRTMTRATGLSVQCERARQLDHTRLTAPYVPMPTLRRSGDFDYEQGTLWHSWMQAVSPEYQRLVDTLNGMHPEEGGVACHAEATVAGVTRRFADDGNGFFKAPLLARSLFTICSPGRASGGRCRGSYALLVGDYSLSANPRGADHSDCMLQGCSNQTYYEMVRALYESNVSPHERGLWGSRLASATRGYSPIDETRFFMSFSGEEHGFVDTVPGGHPHNTSGATAHGARVPVPWSGCWLGMPGC